MAWIARKLGRSKKDKENGDPNMSRCKERFSVREPPVWNNSRDLAGNASFRNSMAEYSKPLPPHPPNPYSVVTEAKTSKASRSCPGGSNGYSYQGHMKNAYANSEAPVPPPRNQSKLNETMQSDREHRYANIQMNRSTYRSSRNQRGYGGRGTSEYGSGSNDPSPTIAYELRHERRGGRKQRVMLDTADTSSNSEYDYEPEQRNPYDELMDNYQRLKQDYTRMKRKRQEVKEALHMERANNANMHHQMEVMIRKLQEQFSFEQAQRLNYEHKFHKAEQEIVKLKNQLAMSSQRRQQMLPPMTEMIPGGMTPVESCSTIAGAGEALCSRSTSNTDLVNADSDLRLHSSSSATPPIQDDVYNEEDEVKNFRISEDEDAMEQPRSERLQEDSDVDNFNGNEPGHHGSCVLTDEDDVENANVSIAPIPRTPAVARSPLRRSYSESDVQERSFAACVENSNDQNDVTVYTSSVDPILAEYSSSFSSDDEKARAVLLWKQLRHQGSLVKCPSRRRKHLNRRTFSRYGKNEAAAISAFDYLQDLSTDISCLEATPGQSPDFN
ncbi:hypothetical protein L596_006885 [Steinernema carpocapsae]|uniref:Uncharacterized protein n=1 Tax=Steinernema carpocapsae TaxID=34508 RepID=A0A4U5P8B0_STECR|nr:hypothetical protein L596_006885 [Steinernema carpocapsae]